MATNRHKEVRVPCPSLLTPFVLSTMLIVTAACDGPMQTVSLTAEDFRFVPDLVQVNSSSPLTLTIFNAGREIHEFDSPILMYVASTASKQSPTKQAGPGILLEPGKSVQLVMAPPPGTYLYICRRKGHANMTGTLIVE